MDSPHVADPRVARIESVARDLLGGRQAILLKQQCRTRPYHRLPLERQQDGRKPLYPTATTIADAIARLELDASSRAALHAEFARHDWNAVASSEVVQALTEGTELHALMLRLLPLAAAYADPPISGYHVGVVARGPSGALYLGSNAEYPGTDVSSTVHGEMAAMAGAWVQGEDRLTDLAVTAAPCGHCRQFLYETHQGEAMRIVTPTSASRPLTALLPDAFGPRDLGIPGPGLMGRRQAPLALQEPPQGDDPLVQTALEAAAQSYARYSGGFAGVALLSASGRCFAGRYAENAAYNPPLSPMASALTLLRLHCEPPAQIVRAVLVQARSQVDHATGCAALLASVSTTPLETLFAVPTP